MFQLKPETILQILLEKHLLPFKKWQHPRAYKDLKWTLFLRLYIFQSTCRLTANLRGKYRVPIPLSPTSAQPPSLSISPTKVNCIYLQLLICIWHIIGTQSPLVYIKIYSWCCTLCRFSNICVMTSIYYYSIKQNSPTALKIL